MPIYQLWSKLFCYTILPTVYLYYIWDKIYILHSYFTCIQLTLEQYGLAVTAIVVWGFIQFLHVSLCSYALIRMTGRADSGITHLSSTVPAVTGPVLALCALSRAPRGTLLWTIHPDDPWLLCSIPLHAPYQFSPSAGWPAGVRENSKPQQLQAAFSDHFQFRLCQSIFTPTRPAMHVNGVRGVSWDRAGEGAVLFCFSPCERPALHMDLSSCCVKCLYIENFGITQ